MKDQFQIRSRSEGTMVQATVVLVLLQTQPE